MLSAFVFARFTARRVRPPVTEALRRGFRGVERTCKRNAVTLLILEHAALIAKTSDVLQTESLARNELVGTRQ